MNEHLVSKRRKIRGKYTYSSTSEILNFLKVLEICTVTVWEEGISPCDISLTPKISIFTAYCILRKMRKLRVGCINAQYMRKICARLSPNAQYMRKICARLYFFPRCAIYAQDLPKIVVISPMRNICTRFAQDCSYFSYAQYMRKICARLYFFP